MKNYFLLLWFLFVLLGCKKYSDDNVVIQLRTPLHRIQGTWQLEEYTINGIDSISNINATGFPTSCKYFRYELRKHKHDNNGEIYMCGNYSVANWDLRPWLETKTLFYTSFLGQPWASDYSGLAVGWKIKRLTNKEFWVEQNLKEKQYRIKLKKVN